MSPDVSEFYTKAITDVITYREKNNVKRNDFVQLLLELKTKGKIEDVDTKYIEQLDDVGKYTKMQNSKVIIKPSFFYEGMETEAGVKLTDTTYNYREPKPSGTDEKSRSNRISVAKTLKLDFNWT